MYVSMSMTVRLVTSKRLRNVGDTIIAKLEGDKF